MDNCAVNEPTVGSQTWQKLIRTNVMSALSAGGVCIVQVDIAEPGLGLDIADLPWGLF